ncbi:MAG TPA: DoxX family protein [Rhizomicrobium sp.]|nr:DoxX family protein [Rhizomicrobium sp.]
MRFLFPDLTNHYARWAPFLLRVMVGYGFMAHGFAKLARGPDNFSHILAALGVPFPTLASWATILVEIFGGAAFLLGALVTLASIPALVVLLVAIVTVHLPNGFSSIKLQSVDAMGAHFGQPGYETDLLYIICILALMVCGAGPWSVDGRVARRLKKGGP